MSSISWQTMADNPHTLDPRYGFVGPQLRFVMVYVSDWHAEDRVTGERQTGTFDELCEWCWKQLSAEPSDTAGQYCKGSGV